MLFSAVHPSAGYGESPLASSVSLLDEWFFFLRGWLVCGRQSLPLLYGMQKLLFSYSVFPDDGCHCATLGVKPVAPNRPPLGPDPGVPACMEETGLRGSDPLCTPPG